MLPVDLLARDNLDISHMPRFLFYFVFDFSEIDIIVMKYTANVSTIILAGDKSKLQSARQAAIGWHEQRLEQQREAKAQRKRDNDKFAINQQIEVMF